MGDHLSDCSPLIGAAALGKLRLVRLLLEGGAQVNGRNPSGETPLLAACKVLRGEPTGPETVKLLTYLLQNKADPNAQDRAGCTPLMYVCMQRAGAQVASTLLAAGAEPSMEDFSGASALVYAINARHQPTLKVLMDACRANGRDIIIIATEMGMSGGPVTRRYLNVPPSPDTSPVSCMSPSDIVIKTGSLSSPEGENVFNFRGTAKRGSNASKSSPCDQANQSGTQSPRPRMSSEPWLAIHNLARLHRAYKEGVRERRLQDREEREGAAVEKVQEDGEVNPEGAWMGMQNPFRRCPAGPSHPGPEPRRSSVDRLPHLLAPHCQARRNTLPCLAVVAPSTLHLPALVDRRPDPHLQVPPRLSTPKGPGAVVRPRPPSLSSSLPRLPAATSLVAPRGRRCGGAGGARTATGHSQSGSEERRELLNFLDR